MGSTRRPNFLIIVADDLGYSDTKPFGSEIETPALDFLARTGTCLTNFHTASACSPTRSMLFSGTDNHIAGLGQMAEHMRNAKQYQASQAALSEVLQDAGYFTAMSGKWHLGLKKEIAPCSRGFEKNFSYLAGCGNHFNYEPQLEHAGDGFLAPLKSSITPILDFQGRRRRPTFLRLPPFTAPHWPLQAPRELINKYKDLYNEGPEVLRQKRLERLIQLGRVPKDVKAAPITLESDDWAWNKLSDEERADSARKMEVFAAMVDLIDQNIQRVIDHLQSTDELDNTFILFMSDNGAEGAMLEALPVMGPSGNVKAIIDKYYDNSLENIGNPDSFVWYGPAWASAAMAPSRGFKTWITEGGIRCPCVVRFPPLGVSNGQTDSFATVMDIFPTILDLAGVPLPGEQFRGREVVPVRGSSWVPHLAGRTAEFHEDQGGYITGWELFGRRAIRQGPWKALYMTAPRGKDRWELYHLEEDPGEVDDRADSEPEILQRLIEHWEVYYAETGMIDPAQEFPYTKI
ncbi:putative arylsulfatase [Aspergillus nomiae NRRL 13137]|uniref:Putative arylsulfatase n=1 Tax=Aspergillus nomiae NRRL (strain ATCC 15546 / NRRL 13137 / CBS 260.88 / M93) TaxID=1509407 RepID=A0A0L1J950_ASPN3|nr:putative arylsulfatase [Aspergillus nomiae NRRL 13137]KNG88336.1 putative arylsulfatase [Aspergillus nomiae NRRL 13137]